MIELFMIIAALISGWSACRVWDQNMAKLRRKDKRR